MDMSMGGDIFLNIDSIVLHGTGRIDRRGLENALRMVLEEHLSLKRTFQAADVQRVQTAVNLSLATVSGEELGRALGERLTATFAATGDGGSEAGDLGSSGGGSNA